VHPGKISPHPALKSIGKIHIIHYRPKTGMNKFHAVDIYCLLLSDLIKKVANAGNSKIAPSILTKNINISKIPISA